MTHREGVMPPYRRAVVDPYVTETVPLVMEKVLPVMKKGDPSNGEELVYMFYLYFLGRSL
jgi:hypothetical protein|tara:strand:+ start:736 stop:915 length:180 start_codon:yes stop_codon:yes gene_type:complete